MKKNCLTITIAVFLLFFSNGIQGQSAPTQLDEFKLTQRFIGTWQMDVGKDSISLWEVQQYNRAFVGNATHVFSGKESFWFEMIWSFYPKEGKSRGYNLYANGGYQTWNASFTSENKWSASFLRDFNPEAVINTMELVFETPTSILVEYFNLKGEKTGEQRFHKIK
jgi:hypothetical protein